MRVWLEKLIYWLSSAAIAGLVSMHAYAWIGNTIPERLVTALLCGVTGAIVWLILGAAVLRLEE